MAKITVYRYDPDDGKGARLEEYDLALKDRQTVLDLLVEIHALRDPSLSFRHACRSGVCGSCGMSMNGRTGLSCTTQAKPLLERDGHLVVEPMRNMRVLKDLVVDMGDFWRSVHDVEPYLRPGGEPTGPYRVPKDAMDLLAIAQECIMCGACVSECTSREASPSFLGPAALAKAYRFVFDPRDAEAADRLASYSEPDGIWDCDTCLYCNEVCPVRVRPMDAIMRMRERSIELGIPSRGANHAIAFSETVLRTGKLNELATMRRSLGFGGMVARIPLAAKMLLRGKSPKARKKPIPGHDDVVTLNALVQRNRRMKEGGS